MNSAYATLTARPMTNEDRANEQLVLVVVFFAKDKKTTIWHQCNARCLLCLVMFKNMLQIQINQKYYFIGQGSNGELGLSVVVITLISYTLV